MVDISSDEAFARRLQEDELRLAGFQHAASSRDSAAERTPISAADLAVRPGHDASSSSGGVGSSGLDSQGHRRSSSSDIDARGGPVAERDPRMQRPLLERALSNRAPAGPHRQVQENALQDSQNIAATSPLVVALQIFLYVIEFCLAAWVLDKGWNKSCDRPLQTWVVVHTLRLGLLVPLKLHRLYHRDEVLDPDNPTLAMRTHAWVQFLSLIWMIVGQFWFFTSESCNPWMHKFVLAMIICFYVGLFLPLVLLLCICLCLPFALIFMHFLQPRPGAEPALINSLPKRNFAPDPAAAPGADAPSCSICMEDYVAGSQIVDLPCHHAYHFDCADKWLRLHATCPLCRAPIGGAAAAAEGDDQV